MNKPIASLLRRSAILVFGLILIHVAAGAAVSDAQLVTLPVRNDPTISFRLWFKVGSQDDPAGKEGLAEITSGMLSDASTTKNTYEQIIDKLFPLAASYNATTSVEMTVFYGRTHKDNLQDYYPLFMDAVLHPAFVQQDLDRIKSQALNYLENTLRYSSDEELGKAVLYGDLFKGTPYGHLSTGTVKSVKSITLEDVRDFYTKHFTQGNVVIGIGGGYDEALVKRLQEDLGTLPAAAPPQVAVSVPSTPKGLRVTIVEKKAPATAISMGFPINILRGTKEWYALAVASSWLGEHRNSSGRLYQVIREERGLNYGDYAYIENYPRGGQLMKPPQNVCRRQQIFEIWIRPVPNETRVFALRAALHEFKNLVEKGLTPEQFEQQRSFLRKYVLLYAPSTMERLGYALDDRFYGINGSHLEKFRKAMDELTVADVNAAIKKYWQFGDMQIAIITTPDGAALKESLVANTPSPITYKTPKPAEVMEADKEIIALPLMVKPENITVVKVEELFN
jgi:zinc protease